MCVESTPSGTRGYIRMHRPLVFLPTGSTSRLHHSTSQAWEKLNIMYTLVTRPNAADIIWMLSGLGPTDPQLRRAPAPSGGYPEIWACRCTYGSCAARHPARLRKRDGVNYAGPPYVPTIRDICRESTLLSPRFCAIPGGPCPSTLIPPSRPFRHQVFQRLLHLR